MIITNCATKLIENTDLTVPQQVIDRMKIRFANYPVMNDKEYKWLIYDTEISYNEYNLIHAMQSAMALDFLESKITNQNFLWLKDVYRWIEHFRPFNGYEEAKKHLEKVDRYYTHKYGQHYTLWWIDSVNEVALLDWSEAMSDRAIQKYGERMKAKKRSSVFEEYN
jgi:hypothetical protein